MNANRKRIFGILLTLTLVLGMIPAVKTTAYAYSSSTSWDDPYVVTTYDELRAIMNGYGVYYIRLGADIYQEDNINENRLFVESRVELDLNGHSLSRKTQSIDKALITVAMYAQLTIFDSSKEKTGSLSYENTANVDSCYIIDNKGILTINGGIFNPQEPYGLQALIGFNLCGATIINDGVFYCTHTGFIESNSDRQTVSTLTGQYPYLVINGGTVYSETKQFSIHPNYPTFITGGTFYNKRPFAYFAWEANGGGLDFLAYCGGTFRCGFQNYSHGVIKVAGTLQYYKTMDDLEYYTCYSPVVITDGTVSVSDRLLAKSIKEFRNYYNSSSMPASETAKNRYPKFFDDTYPEEAVISRNGFTAPELSINNQKAINNTIKWEQAYAGGSFSEIPGTKDRQTITPPDVKNACTMYYRCTLTTERSEGTVTSTDTIKVIYNRPTVFENPTGLRWDGSTARWDPVSNASSYEVRMLNFTRGTMKTYTVSEPQLDVDDAYAALGNGTYSFQVRAAAAGDIKESEWVFGQCMLPIPYVMDDVYATVQEPIAGQKVDFKAVVPEGYMYTATVEWMDRNTMELLKEGDRFEEGVHYMRTVIFSPPSKYSSIPKSGMTYSGLATINGEVMMSFTTVYTDPETGIEKIKSRKNMQAIKDPELERRNVSGRFASSGDASKEAFIQLILQGASEAGYEAVVTGNSSSYEITDVRPGTYIMKVMKVGHCPREYVITVGEADVVKDVEILLYGDINKDGEVNNTDLIQLRRYLNNKSGILQSADKETWTYLKQAADIIADGELNNSDVVQIERYINHKSSVYGSLPWANE